MIDLRDIYVRHFWGIALGNAARRPRYWDWRADVRALKQGILPDMDFASRVGQRLRAGIAAAKLLRHRALYYGTDIDRGAGLLFCEPYRSMGEILYGDSIESLAALDVIIDVFINDSDHSADYEGREYASSPQSCLIAP